MQSLDKSSPVSVAMTDSGNGGPSIRVTKHNELSVPMCVTQKVIRTMRSQINGREPEHEDGSIKLDPSKSKLKGCTLQDRTVCDIHIYDVIPPNKSSTRPRKRVYYFAGGSWQTPPMRPHYNICAAMAKELPDTAVSIVSMPLAPNNAAPSSFPWCLRLYRELMEEAKETGEKIILAGDSSGANVILSLVLEALREDTEAGHDVNQIPHAATIMALCPSTDLTRSNPDIDKIAPKDPLLSPQVIKNTAKSWYGDWDPADRRVSPINNDISLLARRGIVVHGMTAGYDVLSPDGIIFREKCAENGVHGEWIDWQRQMHCFILTFPYGLSEGKQGVRWMIDILKKE